jgi:hypothetical protein
MSRIKRSLAAGIAALALFGLPAAGAGAGVSTQPDHGARAVVAKSCAGYTRAIIGSQIKCLRRGQFCAIRYDRQYHRYGYHCHTGRLR